MAPASTMNVRGASIESRNAMARLVLVSSAVMAMIGTTVSAPVIGTRTSGSSTPVP